MHCTMHNGKTRLVVSFQLHGVVSKFIAYNLRIKNTYKANDTILVTQSKLQFIHEFFVMNKESTH